MIRQQPHELSKGRALDRVTSFTVTLHLDANMNMEVSSSADEHVAEHYIIEPQEISEMVKPDKTVKILIVEDDTNINNLLQEALSKAGYSCEQAFSGTEAKLLLNMQEHSYALVLLDLMLPGITGEAVLEEIRKKGNLPVIVLTAKDSLDVECGGDCCDVCGSVLSLFRLDT